VVVGHDDERARRRILPQNSTAVALGLGRAGAERDPASPDEEEVEDVDDGGGGELVGRDGVLFSLGEGGGGGAGDDGRRGGRG